MLNLLIELLTLAAPANPNTKKTIPMNSADVDRLKYKQQADAKAEAEIRCQNETDPLKKLKMQNRIQLGVYDFSDL